MTITAGHGSESKNNADGGAVELFGGQASGGEPDTDAGGDILLEAGVALDGVGGSILMRTGFGEASSSGDFTIMTASAGTAGVRRALDLSTGTTSSGNSGSFMLSTGAATSGRAGAVSVKVGTMQSPSDEDDPVTGGAVTIMAGGVYDEGDFSGGRITLRSGYATYTSSGNVELSTTNAGDAGVSGRLYFHTGTSSTAAGTGSLSIMTGRRAARSWWRLDCHRRRGTSGVGGAIALQAGL